MRWIGIVLLAGCFLLTASALYFVTAGTIVTLTANVSATDTYTAIETDVDYVGFGNLRKGDISQEQKVCVNNTGTTSVTVTPLLQNSTSWIFNNVQVRKFGGPVNSHVPIGQYNMNLTSGAQGCLWLRLNLNVTTPIYQDIVGSRAEIMMRALPIV